MNNIEKSSYLVLVGKDWGSERLFSVAPCRIHKGIRYSHNIQVTDCLSWNLRHGSLFRLESPDLMLSRD
jgi:hypothetical protein